MNRLLIRQTAAAALAAILCALSVPAAPALADGAASTRNIILGGAAAALLIINHNKKVHERYAEDARRQAAAEQDAHNMWVAYQDERTAYNNEVALNQSLQHEVAVQHSMIVAQQHQLGKQHHQIVTMRSRGTVAGRAITHLNNRRPTSVARNDQPAGAGSFMQQTTLTRSARAQTSRRTHQTRTQLVLAQAFGWGSF